MLTVHTSHTPHVVADVTLRLTLTALRLVNDLQDSTPACEWPHAADRELLTVYDLLTGAGVDAASVLPHAVTTWLHAEGVGSAS